MTPEAANFKSKILNFFLFKFFLLLRLPMAFFARLNVSTLSDNECKVTVPYNWLNQNPFKSTYFAVLSMAAEMSTGVLGLMATHKREKNISMLVVNLEGTFIKKATELITFTCSDGEQIWNAVAKTLETGEGIVVKTTSIGINPAGEEVARFNISWSFKAKK